MEYDEEIRFCDNCMRRTKHLIIIKPEIVTYKRKRLYKCTICKKESWKRGLRPSSEAVY
ncbi:MAG: hypothetical protein KatS3mg003_1670 [Candidatus Nitrosocaldaceae archaeon]|nr:MAG: hypothetical protein KatS3mg003_1670 [Candidatus Nitrosocaldaceae archaeon]